MNTKRLCPFLLLLMFALLPQGCNSTPPPPAAPAPQTVSGMTRDRTRYTFLKWNAGLAVMLVDHCDASSMSSENDSGKPFQCRGKAHWYDRESNEWKDGYEWELKTTDGRTAVFTINNVEYDLSKGATFYIDISGEKPAVQQFEHDLSKIQPDIRSCDHFVAATPELKKAADKPTTD